MSVIYTLAVCVIICLIAAIEFIFCRIISRLDKIHTTLDFIHQDLVKVWMALPAYNQQTKKKRHRMKNNE